MHQYLFYIGDFPIRMYGLVLCMSIFLLDIGIYGGFAGLIGARLWDVFFFDWDYYQHHLLEIPFVWQGGMAVQGGIIAGVLTGIWYCKRHNIDWVAFADIVTPSILIGQAVGRMANLLNGDAFGTPTGGNFGILYPVGTLAHKTYGSQPLEVWEGQLDVVIFAFLLIFRACGHARGQVMCLYVMLYSAVRFGLEMLRGDYVEPFLFGLKSAQATAQATSLIFFLIALAAFIYCGVKDKKKTAASKTASKK